jgi:class 3 adenylate cyclase
VLADGATADAVAAEGAGFAGAGGLQRILIGESTRRLLGDAFVVEDLGVHGVKGRSEPIHIYRVVGERDAGPREGRA